MHTDSRPVCLIMSVNEVVDLSTMDNSSSSGSDGGSSTKVKPEVRDGGRTGDRDTACV